VLSMKAMLEPMMVAASIHVLAAAPHGAALLPDRITASSQGDLIDAMDASCSGYGSEDAVNDRINSVERLRTAPLTAFILALLAASLGCGQFFPGANSITSLAVAPLNATVAPGVTQQYSATATYGNNTTADVTSTVSWSTTQTNIATISSSGLLTGVALGTATVQAQSGSVIATTGVTVTTKQVTSVSIAPLTQTLSLSLGPTTVQFTATATYKDGSTGDVTATSTWTATPSSVATISSTGLASAVAVGTSTVTATTGGVTSNSATITVSP